MTWSPREKKNQSGMADTKKNTRKGKKTEPEEKAGDKTPPNTEPPKKRGRPKTNRDSKKEPTETPEPEAIPNKPEPKEEVEATKKPQNQRKPKSAGKGEEEKEPEETRGLDTNPDDPTKTPIKEVSETEKEVSKTPKKAKKKLAEALYRTLGSIGRTLQGLRPWWTRKYLEPAGLCLAGLAALIYLVLPTGEETQPYTIENLRSVSAEPQTLVREAKQAESNIRPDPKTPGKGTPKPPQKPIPAAPAEKRQIVLDVIRPEKFPDMRLIVSTEKGTGKLILVETKNRKLVELLDGHAIMPGMKINLETEGDPDPATIEAAKTMKATAAKLKKIEIANP